MSHYPTTIRDLTGNATIEQMEMTDRVGFTGLPDDCNAEMEAAFGYGEPVDEMTEREIDAMFVAEMTRRDRNAAAVFSGDDTDPERTPPAAAHPHHAFCVDQCAAWSDDDLLAGVGLCDEGRAAWGDEGMRAAWLDAATAEVLRRLDGAPAARKAA